jgi:hypothetical protein
LAKLRQRLERARKTTTTRGLRVNLALKRTLCRRARCVFVAAMPKSASTFLATCLAEITGFARFFLGQNYLAEQDIYMPRLIDAWSMDIVCQQHVRAVRPNLELMAEFSIRPVVLVRDIGDAVVSLRDHLRGESPTTPVFDAPMLPSSDVTERPNSMRSSISSARGTSAFMRGGRGPISTSSGSPMTRLSPTRPPRWAGCSTTT